MDICGNSRANTCEKLRLALSGAGRSVFIRLKTNASPRLLLVSHDNYSNRMAGAKAMRFEKLS